MTTHDRVIKALRAAAETLQAASSPQIYVAHLGAYVAGKLRGDWIEPSTDKDELWKQIQEAVGVKEGQDFEWAIHDYDNFPDLGENPSLDDICAVAEMLEDNDDADVVVAALSETSNDVGDAKRLLKNGYAIYDSEQDAGERLVDDMGVENISNKESYVDLDQLARDLLMDESIVYVNGKPFVFHN